ncbi:MAG: fumarylacetoacetate hydrolase family protein [Gammaproteobacteria bacterium]|nr:fumarylacetoacetate hydrolase family protein [Gammaproteobacteria bacterium]
MGMNYADHASEFGAEVPAHPTIFTKQVSCIGGPRDPIHLPRVSDALDYEGELVLVIGRRCRHVPVTAAHRVIGGYCVGNDVSVRDWQLRTGQFTIGKSFDTHGPIGPWITTADEIGDPQALSIRTLVNDELRQSASTADMIFDCATLVSHLSTAFTLEPGDLIFTGTPSGIGAARTPPAYLRAGDRVRIEIEGLGGIDNAVVPEPDRHTVLVPAD